MHTLSLVACFVVCQTQETRVLLLSASSSSYGQDGCKQQQEQQKQSLWFIADHKFSSSAVDSKLSSVRLFVLSTLPRRWEVALLSSCCSRKPSSYMTEIFLIGKIAWNNVFSHLSKVICYEQVLHLRNELINVVARFALFMYALNWLNERHNATDTYIYSHINLPVLKFYSFVKTDDTHCWWGANIYHFIQTISSNINSCYSLILNYLWASDF